MPHVTSADGTRICYDRVGTGPVLILVVGAFNTRSTGTPLAEVLAPHFTVYTYDRRGRGESGDTLPYAVEREIEDLAALIAKAGGSASLFGFSSGAILALKAAAHGLAVGRLALYDAPFNDPASPPPPLKHGAEIAALIDANRRGDAVEYFQSEVVGLPAELVTQMRHAPFRPALEQMAHTLVYDLTIIGDGSLPTNLAAVTQPTLVLDGGDFGNAPMSRAAQALAPALPNGRHRSLGEQRHQIVPEVMAPVLKEFLSS